VARIRTIKPEFFKDEKVADLDPEVRLLFIGLWTLADREGRLADKPRWINVELFPYAGIDIASALCSLEKSGLIIRYEANMHPFIQIVNFLKHQRPNNKEDISKIPPPEGYKEGPRVKNKDNMPEDITRSGFIYFIEAGEGGPIKIGFSQNPWARLNDLQGASPQKYKIVATIKGTMRQESEWHNQFKSSCIDREWFTRTPELIKEIERCVNYERTSLKLREGEPGLLKGEGKGNGSKAGKGNGEKRRRARKPRTPPLTDEEFIQALKANPAYSGVDVDLELAKIDAWLLTPRGRGKTKTRGRILNWLNRADRSMAPQPTRKPRDALCKVCGADATVVIGYDGYCSKHADRHWGEENEQKRL